VEIPSNGGTVSEGIIGTPRYINPVLAVSQADKDMTQLIYAGLLKKTQSGDLEKEMAESYSLSEDGTVYTITLKDNLYFHDGVKVTAYDVAFTIQSIQDPAINSPLLGNWAGVSVEVISSHELQFILEKPYGPFINNLTVGILPKHLWENTSAEQFALNSFNIEPIGSGPFMIKEIKRKDGVPEIFRLIPAKDYSLGEPHLKDLIIHSYPDEERLIQALIKGTVDSCSGISPQNIGQLSHLEIASISLPRVFSLYLNQNKADIFTQLAVRKAIYAAVNRSALIDAVFRGYATPLFGSLPPNPLIYTSEPIEESSTDEILNEAGWIQDATSTMRTKDGQPLTFRLATSNHPELKQSAEIIASQLQEYGIGVDLEFYDLQDLKQNIIRPREFQGLLFGVLLDSNLDLYPLWHSSQRNDPGLNISQYTNIEVDSLLEKARNAETPETKKEALENVMKEIQTDVPTIPLYSPHLIYIKPKHVHNNEVTYIEEPQDRFIDIHTWYIETRNVWNIFI